jgi:serine protease Do
VVVLGLVLALVVVGGASQQSALASESSRRTPITVAVEKSQPSVVSITSEKKAASTSRWPFTPEENQRPRISGMGTGVILDGRGYILTNHHVVDKVQGIEVHLSDGTSYPARLLQYDPVMDLAMLKVDPERPLPPIAIGTSQDLMVGESVITIGNAFGYENTVAVGIVSALKRNVTLSDEQVYRNLIQTDAAINPGNSGGPLINIDGELIGINVAVRAGAQGIGFALPIDDVKVVAADMMSTRRLARTWHGLVAGEVKVAASRAVVLAEVQGGSPAEAAGFRAGDEVVQVGEQPVQTPLDIERALLDVPPGRPTRVLVRRGGQEQALDLELRSLTGAPPARTSTGPSVAAVDPAELVYRLLGLKTQPVTPEYVAAASPQLHGGLFVREVSRGSLGERAQIQKGDILVGMNVGVRHWETLTPENVLFILRQPEVPHSQKLSFYIVRRNVIHLGSMCLAEILAPSILNR